MSEYSHVDTYLEPLSIMKNFSEKKSEMEDVEIGFICGLIKEYRPGKIVEVGIAAGGTTAVLLHCVDMLGLSSEIYSVDLSENYYRDNTKKTGFLVDEIQDLKKDNHKFLLGKVLPERLEDIGKDIDFLILDTMHTLPGEVIDFLAAYPYLKKNAIVILHDTAFHIIWNIRHGIATSILFQTVSAKKMLNNKECYPNIAAFQLNESTGENIQDVFDSLMIPWEYIPSEKQLSSYEKIFSQYYSKGCMKLYMQALDASKKLDTDRFNDDLDMYFNPLKDSLFNTFKYVLLYGAGHWGKAFLNIAQRYGIQIKGFVVSDEKDIESTGSGIPIFHFSEIPFEKESVLIVQTVDSKEIEEKMCNSQYHWLKVPSKIWTMID